MERLNPAKVLVFIPTWGGDAVMATPALEALRSRFPQAEITAVARPYVAEVLAGHHATDGLVALDSLGARSLRALVRDALAMRGERFDLAVLLTNSFRTALFAWLAGVPRRLGYRREWRGFLLTDWLDPVKSGGRYAPGPMVDYYLDLVSVFGAPPVSRRMSLAVTDREKAAADRLLADLGVAGEARIVVMNPGAAFGSAKCWPAENFAAVADRLADCGLDVLVVTGPAERDIGEAIGAAAEQPLKPAWRRDVPLGVLKALVARAALLVTNDSGPRHFGAALGVPVVTIMGPTDPRWSETGWQREAVIRKDVECGPCMLRVCPRDHACMTLIGADEVVEAALGLLEPAGPGRKS